MIAMNEIVNLVIFLLIIKLVYTKIQKSKTESVIKDLVEKIHQLEPMKERSKDNDELRFSNHSQMIKNNKRVAALVPDQFDSIRDNQSAVIRGLKHQNETIEVLSNRISTLINSSISERSITELSNQLTDINQRYVSDLTQLRENANDNSVIIAEVADQQTVSKQRLGEFITYLKNELRVINDHIIVIKRKIREDY